MGLLRGSFLAGVRDSWPPAGLEKIRRVFTKTGCASFPGVVVTIGNPGQRLVLSARAYSNFSVGDLNVEKVSDWIHCLCQVRLLGLSLVF